jgi:hypothetical protein
MKKFRVGDRVRYAAWKGVNKTFDGTVLEVRPNDKYWIDYGTAGLCANNAENLTLIRRKRISTAVIKPGEED